MLIILIKVFCVNVVVDIKPIYLNKHPLFHNKIYYLDKIYFCFAIIKLFKHTIKKEALVQMFACEFCEISKNTLFTENPWATASKQVTVPLQCLRTAKSLISSYRRTGETILSNYWQNPKITATVHYFPYNSHHRIILIIAITIIAFITIVKCTFTVWKFY